MYDANASYEENYERGPQARLTRQGAFPRVTFEDAPRFSFLGRPLWLPFGVPAGPLLNARYVDAALQAGFCLPVYKTVRSRAWASHPHPNVLSVKSRASSLWADRPLETVTGEAFSAREFSSPPGLSISNSFGVPSRDPQVWSVDFQTLKGRGGPGQHVVLSFQGSRPAGHDGQDARVSFEAFVEDSAQCARLAVQAATDAGFGLLEINLSCPNEKGEPVFKDVSQSVALLKAVRDALRGFPDVRLIAKVGVLPFDAALSFVRETHGVLDGVSAINTVPARILAPSGGLALGAGTDVGGVCGALILEQGLAMIARLHDARMALGVPRAEYGLIGVGGVTTPDDALRYLAAGADVVQAATGAMWNAELALEFARALDVPHVVSPSPFG